MKPIIIIPALFTVLLAGFSFRGVAYAQDPGVKDNIFRKLLGGDKPRNKNSSKPKPINPRTPVRRAPLIKTVIKKPTTGTLSIAAESNADLLIEPVDISGAGARDAQAQEATIPAGERGWVFEDLRPGRWRVVAGLDGYEEEVKDVTIKASENAKISFILKPVTHDVTFKTNVVSGDVRYAPVKAKADKSGEYRRTGSSYCVARIENGRAELSKMLPGTYGVDIVPDDVAYQPFYGTFTLPDDTLFDVSLKDAESKTKFHMSAGLDLPSNWELRGNKLSVKGAGMALPRDPYRNYKDFELRAEVRMINEVGISFVLRADADKRNYYLVRITGANHKRPNWFSVSAVRDGREEALSGTTAAHVIGKLKSEYFSVSIKAFRTPGGNWIEASVTDYETATRFSLGGATDGNSYFKIGAVGIAADAGEENEVGDFIVCPGTC